MASTALRSGSQSVKLGEIQSAQHPTLGAIAELLFENFSVIAIRKTPSHIVLIVATLAAPASDIKAALAVEFVDQIQFSA